MRIALLAIITASMALSACSGTETDTASEDTALVVYSGRSEELIGPLVQQFEQETGTDVEVRYGDTAELAAQLLEEGDNSPAGVFFSQDAGALQVLEDAGLTTALAADLTSVVPARFRSAQDQWVGASGRARVLVYNTDEVPTSDLPDSVQDLTAPDWKGEVGIAPTNASFQSFVTAMRKSIGEQPTKQWLEGLVANDVQSYENNSGVLDAVDAGQVDVGLLNHYYLFEKAAEVGEQNLKARNAAFAPGDPGNLVNVAGLAVLEPSEDASAFVAYMLGQKAQEYFAQEVSEYPLVKGVAVKEGLPPLSEVQGPDLPLEELRDLQGTQDMLMDVGLL